MLLSRLMVLEGEEDASEARMLEELDELVLFRFIDGLPSGRGAFLE